MSKYSDSNTSEGNFTDAIPMLYDLKNNLLKEPIFIELWLHVAVWKDHHANITETFKHKAKNIVQLCSLYGIQYDLQWLLTTQNL